MRQYATEELEKLFPSHGKFMENELYSWVKDATLYDGTCGLDFYQFRRMYERKLQSALENLHLSKSPFRKELEEDPQKWAVLIRLTSKDWNPAMWQVSEAVQDDQVREGKFECKECARKCRYSKNTTDYQRQLRSADEPMTTFVHCHTCKRIVSKFSA